MTKGGYEDPSNYSRRFGVKQFVARIATRTGQTFNVFTCGDEKYYIFDPIDVNDCSYCNALPVRRRELRRDVRRALAHGWGNVDEAARAKRRIQGGMQE